MWKLMHPILRQNITGTHSTNDMPYEAMGFASPSHHQVSHWLCRTGRQVLGFFNVTELLRIPFLEYCNPLLANNDNRVQNSTGFSEQKCNDISTLKLSIYCDPMWHGISYNAIKTEIEWCSGFQPTKDIQHHKFMGKQYGTFCELCTGNDHDTWRVHCIVVWRSVMCRSSQGNRNMELTNTKTL